MYGIIMSWPDAVICTGIELCTKIPTVDIREIYTILKNTDINPRDYKMKLAFEITKINHGEELARKAQEHFVKTVQNKEIPDDIEEQIIKEDRILIIDLLVNVGLATSKGEARRLIKQNGIKVDGKLVSDSNLEIELNKEGQVLQRGKRQFVKIKN